MKINPETFTINDYLNKSYDCDCGHTHYCEIEEAVIESGAVNRTGELVKKYGHKKVFVVSDIHTYEIAGKAVIKSLEEQNIPYISYIYKEDFLTPDELALGKLIVRYEPDCDLIVAVGSGVINDLCKFVAHKAGIKYYIVATAPSMDGYASGGASITVEGLKGNIDGLHLAQVIIGDLDVLSQAPMVMIASGVGDTLGKYTALTDWELAKELLDEYYCPACVEMVRHSLNLTAQNVDAIKDRDPQAIKNLMEALILTGVAMSYMKASRPASGCEHHMSHYWEMLFIFEGRKAALHGTKVGIGTVIATRLFSELKNIKPDFEKARKHADEYDYESWKKLVTEKYGPAAGEIIALEEKAQKNSPENVKKRIDIVEKKWDKILEIIEKDLPERDYTKKLLEKLDAATVPADLDISDEYTYDCITLAKEVRSRYTLLQMFYDLGILEEMARKIAFEK